MPRQIPISEARGSLPDIVDSGETFVITKRGRPRSVLIDYDRYQAMQMDLNLLANPNVIEILREHVRFQDEMEEDERGEARQVIAG